MTETLTEQVTPLAAMVPPAKLMLVPPGVAVTVPPQVVATLLGVATVRPPGKLSVKAALVAALVAVLARVTVSVDVPVALMAAGANALFTVTAACAAELMSRKQIENQAAQQTRLKGLRHLIAPRAPRLKLISLN